VVETGITYAGVIGLEKSNLEAFVGEVALGLSKVNGSMVGSGMPMMISQHHKYIPTTTEDERATDQLVKKVIFSVDILSVGQGM
jgi:hypothetical protein